MTSSTATQKIKYAYIQARGRQATQVANYIAEAEKQGVEIVEGTFTYRARRYLPTFTALNIAFEGPADAVESLGVALDEGLSDPL